MEFVPEEHNCGALLFKHVAMKGAQAGSVLGVASVAPSLLYTAYRQGSGAVTADAAFTMAATRAGTGLTYGLAAMSVAAALKVMNTDKDGLQDRAYRLHYNEAQNRCDKIWLVSSALGAGTGWYLGGAPKQVLGTSALAGALGIFIHSILPMPSKEE
mmetsp:Transcript_3904/g.11061  ORF Transcript_3904/g.11061 Transcript_3904/m.11061 type:complete len:157 (+) Transcript_3904:281-751(+)|eukprot:CAMPEP_0117655778 /NCGR_PEP_ID=MMETSP0804-20121206/4458_1 /TAXON_ID=1074897 /ORGANISM="Tetraselmis astigmatica, Strain CCMP880" /LENGTH=156 /DNA_ID=CAMNT_0005462147 /DNA_START=230 /DNA_END=700 /DNA_ORIENTATION=+